MGQKWGCFECKTFQLPKLRKRESKKIEKSILQNDFASRLVDQGGKLEYWKEHGHNNETDNNTQEADNHWFQE